MRVGDVKIGVDVVYECGCVLTVTGRSVDHVSLTILRDVCGKGYRDGVLITELPERECYVDPLSIALAEAFG